MSTSAEEVISSIKNKNWIREEEALENLYFYLKNINNYGFQMCDFISFVTGNPILDSTGIRVTIVESEKLVSAVSCGNDIYIPSYKKLIAHLQKLLNPFAFIFSI
jgi:hypothetical protein